MPNPRRNYLPDTTPVHTARNRFVLPSQHEFMWVTPSGNQRPSAGSYADKVANRPEDYRVLERLPLGQESIPTRFEGTGEPVKWVAILDTETTGLESDAEVIELAIVRCGVDDSDRLCSLEEMLDEFNDPGFEIPVEVSELTGITDDMVRGRRVDVGKVEHILRGDPVIIAHNAKFDRPFFEKLFKDDGHRWACSMKYCSWRGFSGRSLGCMVQQEGFFFDAHRAYVDCLAVAALLHRVPGSLAEILTPPARVVAGGNSFDVKEELKERWYRWNNVNKIWHKVVLGGVDGPDAKYEMEFLKELYPGGCLSTCKEIDQRMEFKPGVY